mmetsp:Transcript_67659/g.132684  ORF Transcript_67659/g.132684 Transcript_67659/m.132684 type:complete len:202 (-) Transcript_67659:454-1059(-)
MLPRPLLAADAFFVVVDAFLPPPPTPALFEDEFLPPFLFLPEAVPNVPAESGAPIGLKPAMLRSPNMVADAGLPTTAFADAPPFLEVPLLFAAAAATDLAVAFFSFFPFEGLATSSSSSLPTPSTSPLSSSLPSSSFSSLLPSSSSSLSSAAPLRRLPAFFPPPAPRFRAPPSPPPVLLTPRLLLLLLRSPSLRTSWGANR